MKHIFILLLLLILAACRDSADPALSAEPAPTLSAEVIAGKKVFKQHCGACHSLFPDDVIVGPSLKGIATRANSRVSGQDAERYLYTSILKPDAYLVEGFDNLMPSTLAKQLTGEELDAVIVYLLTLD